MEGLEELRVEMATPPPDRPVWVLFREGGGDGGAAADTDLRRVIRVWPKCVGWTIADLKDCAKEKSKPWVDHCSLLEMDVVIGDNLLDPTSKVEDVVRRGLSDRPDLFYINYPVPTGTEERHPLLPPPPPEEGGGGLRTCTNAPALFVFAVVLVGSTIYNRSKLARAWIWGSAVIAFVSLTWSLLGLSWCTQFRNCVERSGYDSQGDNLIDLVGMCTNLGTAVVIHFLPNKAK